MRYLSLLCLLALAGCGSGGGSPAGLSVIGTWRETAWSAPGGGQHACTGQESTVESSVGPINEGCLANEMLSFTAGQVGQASSGFTGGQWAAQNVDSVNIYSTSGVWIIDGSGNLSLSAGGWTVTYRATGGGSTLTLSPVGTNSETSYWQRVQ